MSCVRHETLLREHAHGVPLSPPLEAHLASCPVCREVLTAERRLLSEIDRALDGIGRVEPSPAFLARARVIALTGPRRLLPSGPLAVLGRLPVWLLPALAAALLIAALTARTRPPGEPRRDATSVSSTPPFAATPYPARAPTPPLPSPAPLSSEPLRLARASRETAAATRRSLPRPPSPEPPAIVPPGQAEALVRLATLIDVGSVAPPSLLLELPDPAQGIRQPAELSFRPLTIPSIVHEGTDDEGDTP